MDYLTYPFRFIGFWLWFIKEFTVANHSVLKDILSRGHDSTPGIARYPCESESEAHYTLIAALITVTPGTLVVGAAANTEEGQRVMYVHGMYNSDADELRADLRAMEERMLRGVMIHPHFCSDRKKEAYVMVLNIAIVVVALSIIPFSYRMLIGPTRADRVSAADALLFVLVALIALIG